MSHSLLSPQSENSPFVVDALNSTDLEFNFELPLTSNGSLPDKQQLLQPTTTTSSQQRSQYSLLSPASHYQQQQQNQYSQPSFPYDLYTQQTGPLPVMYQSSSLASSSSSLDLGLDLSVDINGTSSNTANDQGGNDFLDSMEQGGGGLYNTPAFFFPETTANGFNPTTQQQQHHHASNSTNFMSANMMGKTLQSNAIPIIPGAVLPAGQRPYAGMHHDYAVQQQQMILARQKKEKEMKSAQLKMAQAPKSSTELDREQKIQALLQSIKVDPNPLPATNQKHLPHIARSRKEQDEMDEDERLLASEEGKKLTSKERRQLRNKVSARAFRSRRKEYISQLETEVDKKTTETNSLAEQVRALTSENQRLHTLTRTLLESPAFSTFLETMSGDAFLAQYDPTNSSHLHRNPSAQLHNRSTPKDINPNAILQQSNVSDQDSTWPLAYSNLNAPSIWMNPNGHNQQVFRVTDLPSPAVIQDAYGRAIITEDDYFNPLIASGKDAFSWLSFPSPCDGFDSKDADVLPEDGCQLLSWSELYSSEAGQDEYDPDANVEYPDSDLHIPEDLMELYETECGPTLPDLSTSVNSSPCSSRSGSVSSTLGAIMEEDEPKPTVIKKEFNEKDYRKMFMGIAEVFMGERMDLCRPGPSKEVNPFASSGSGSVMVGASLVEERTSTSTEKQAFRPIEEVRKEVQSDVMPVQISGKSVRSQAHFSRIEDVMKRVGARCGL